MTCQQAIDLLAEYLESTLSPDVLAGLEEHFRDCAPCRAYLATYRKTRDLTGVAGREEMPDEMKARLHRFLVEQLRGGGP